MSARFAQLTPETMTPEQARVAEAIAGSRGGFGARGPFNIWLRVPELADRMQQVGAYIRYQARLGPRLIEWAICATAVAWRAPYEWHAHAPLALKAGIARAQLAALAEGRRPEGLDPAAEVVLDVVQALTRQGRLEEALFARARDTLGEEGLVELLLTCGYYTAVAFTLNAGEVPLPAGAEPFALPPEPA
ncbi:MAG: carboxymuconolactone decarboxylase family protein [Rhodovarius sp.]|nr:carboxymuconolactone decarboxylase family protein [Rhodovarius sp.]